MINIEKSLELFSNKFFELHPMKSLPEWYPYYTDLIHARSKDSNKIIFAVVSAKKKELEAGEWYEEFQGKDMLAKKIPGTQNKGFVINHEPEVITIFSAEINEETTEIKILVDLDINIIDRMKLIKLR
jgi:hypothetical protein